MSIPGLKFFVYEQPHVTAESKMKETSKADAEHFACRNSFYMTYTIRRFIHKRLLRCREKVNMEIKYLKCFPSLVKINLILMELEESGQTGPAAAPRTSRRQLETSNYLRWEMWK